MATAPTSDSENTLEALPETPLRSNREFMTVVVGQGISALGDAVNFTALPLLVLYLTGSGFVMGIVGVLGSIPDLAIGLFAGAFADRWDRRRMMLYADLGRAVLTALIPLSVVFGWPTIAVVLLVTFPIQALRVLFMAAYTGAVPNLVGRHQIGQATSVLEAIYSLGWILGPAIAGVLAATIGPTLTIALDAASFVISAAALGLVRRPLRAERSVEPAHILSEIREGIRYVVRHRLLRTAILFWGMVMIGDAALVPATTYFIIRDLGLGPEAVGLVVSGFGLGSFGGAIAAGFLTRRAIGLPLLAGNAITALALLGLALQSSLPPMVVLALIAGMAQSVVLVSYVTLRAQVTPDELIGRVGSTGRTVSLGLQPLGFLGAGVLLDLVAGRITLATMALFLLAASILFSFSSTLRSARPMVRSSA